MKGDFNHENPISPIASSPMPVLRFGELRVGEPAQLNNQTEALKQELDAFVEQHQQDLFHRGVVIDLVPQYEENRFSEQGLFSVAIQVNGNPVNGLSFEGSITRAMEQLHQRVKNAVKGQSSAGKLEELVSV